MEKKESRFLFWFLGFLFFAFVLNIGTLVLIHEEPRRGIITFEMLKTHNFLQPTVLGVPYFKKPPFHEWVTSLFSVFGGVSEATLRLPSAVSVILTSLTVFFFAERFFDRKRALLSALVYPTFFMVLFGYATKCEPDALFTFLVTLSTFSWFYLIERNEFFAWTVGYFFVSLSLLTKGLPALQFFAFFVISYFAVKRDFRKLFSLKHLFGFLIGISPFVFWVLSVDSERALGALFSEVVGRAPGKVNVEKSLEHYVTYPLRFVAASFPWSLFLIKAKKERFKFEEETLKIFFLAFVLDAVLYWVFPGSRLRYLMPAFPLFAVVISYLLAGYEIDVRKSGRIFRSVVEIVVPIGILLGLLFSKNSYLTLGSTLTFLLFLYPVYFVFMSKFNFGQVVKLVALVMLILRGFWSCYYYPIAEYKYPKVRRIAKEIVKDSKGYPLFTKTFYLQLCFYVEKYGNKILKFTQTPPVGSLFISQKPEGEILKVYRLGKHTFYLCSNSLTNFGKTEETESLKVKSQ
jgi:4-amino-4-deoxy-L-arabinose transferase-like glycosyltransferase